MRGVRGEIERMIRGGGGGGVGGGGGEGEGGGGRRRRGEFFSCRKMNE